MITLSQTLSSILPILVGISAGLCYGGSFILQQKNLLFDSKNLLDRLPQLVFFLIRIGILFYAGSYLLRSALIPSILGSIAFFGMFWLVILMTRFRFHERI